MLSQLMNPQVINLTYLDKVTGGDAGMKRLFINSYIENAPSCMRDLSKAMSERNWSQLKKAAHTFKPQINYMGLDEIIPLIQEVEDSAAEETNLDSLPEKVNRINTIGAAAIEALRDVLNKL